MFNIDRAIIEWIKSLSILGGGFKEGLMILSGAVIYALACVECERKRNSR